MMMIRLGFVLLIVVCVLLFRLTSQLPSFSRTVHFPHRRCHRRSVTDNRVTLTGFTTQFLYYPQILQTSRLLLRLFVVQFLFGGGVQDFGCVFVAFLGRTKIIQNRKQTTWSELNGECTVTYVVCRVRSALRVCCAFRVSCTGQRPIEQPANGRQEQSYEVV